MDSLTPYLDRVARRTSPDVFHASNWGISWGREVVDELKGIAKASVRSRARLCLHPSPDDLHQEMLIVFANTAIESVQRRTIGFDTKIALEGRATLRYYLPTGELTREIKLGHEHAIYVHTSGNEYHSLTVETDWFVFLEVLQGPFDGATTEFAPRVVHERLA